MHTQTQRVASIVFLSVYTLMLYFQAATASIDDRYYPGIEALQALAAPNLLLLSAVVFAWIANSESVSEAACKSSAWAIGICFFMLIAISVSQPMQAAVWVPNESRTMRVVLKASLFSPSFSGRSTAYLIFSGAVAAMSFGALRWRMRKSPVDHSL